MDSSTPTRLQRISLLTRLLRKLLEMFGRRKPDRLAYLHHRRDQATAGAFVENSHQAIREIQPKLEERGSGRPTWGGTAGKGGRYLYTQHGPFDWS
jgi:hypothetical protein